MDPGNLNQQRGELDELLAAIMAENPPMSRDTVERLSARYPAHRAEILDWAVAGWMECEVSSETEGTPEQDAAATKRAERILQEYRAAQSKGLASLADAARERGMEPSAFTSELGIGSSVFWKLERRLIEAATIPASLLDRIAKLLEAPRVAVENYLRLPPTLSHGASFYANEPPKAARAQTWVEALETAPDMSAEQKVSWRSEAASPYDE